MSETVTVTTTITDPTANDIELSVVDATMPAGASAKVQAIALVDLVPNGQGGYTSTGFYGSPDWPFMVRDQGANVVLNSIDNTLSSRLTALQNTVELSTSAVFVAEALDINGDTVVVPLSNTTPATLYAAPANGERIDLRDLIITNTDTVDALVDFVCGARTTTVIVKAGSTFHASSVVRGIANTEWTVALQSAPATGSRRW